MTEDVEHIITINDVLAPGDPGNPEESDNGRCITFWSPHGYRAVRVKDIVDIR